MASVEAEKMIARQIFLLMVSLSICVSSVVAQDKFTKIVTMQQALIQPESNVNLYVPAEIAESLKSLTDDFSGTVLPYGGLPNAGIFSSAAGTDLNILGQNKKGKTVYMIEDHLADAQVQEWKSKQNQSRFQLGFDSAGSAYLVGGNDDSSAAVNFCKIIPWICVPAGPEKQLLNEIPRKGIEKFTPISTGTAVIVQPRYEQAFVVGDRDQVYLVLNTGNGDLAKINLCSVLPWVCERIEIPESIQP